MTRANWLGMVFGGTVLAGMTAWGFHATPEVQVERALVTAGAITRRVVATGTVQAVTTVEVGSQVSGIVRSLDVDFNSMVRAGQVVARLNPELYVAQLQQARAARDQAEANSLGFKVAVEDAQTKLARAEALLGTVPTHVDVHRHAHRAPGVLAGLAQVARRRGLPVRALGGPMRAELRSSDVRTTDHFVGEAKGDAYWTESRFAETVGQLPEGTTELMCHPGYPPRDIRTSYGLQRAVELATLTSSAARRALAGAGVTLASFGDLR